MYRTNSVVSIRRKKTEDIHFIILGANIPYGMKSYGPKPLLKIDNDCLLERQIKSINNIFPKSQISLVIGYEADKIIKYKFKNVRLIENQKYEDTNEAEQVRLAINSITESSVFIINGDIVFEQDIFNNINTNHSFLIYSNESNNDLIGATVVNNEITTLSFGIKQTKWCDILYLTGKEFDIFKNLINNREKSKLFLFEIINIMLEKTGPIKGIHTSKSIKKILTSKIMKE